MVIGYFFYIYTLNASTIVVLSFVCDWLILSAGDTVAVLPQSVAVVCLPTARGGCYWSADGAHNSITSARSSASCLTLFHSSLPFPYSASLFPSFHPSFLVSSPLSSSVNLFISPPTRLCLARASVCGAVRASVSALWAKDAAAKGGLG